MMAVSWRGARTAFVAGILASASVVAGPAQAATGEIFKTGTDLYPLCVSSDEDELVACDWYLMGVFDATTLYADVEYSDKLICVNRSVDAKEVRAIVVKYMEASESVDFSAVSMIFNALQEAFPCEDSG